MRKNQRKIISLAVAGTLLFIGLVAAFGYGGVWLSSRLADGGGARNSLDSSAVIELKDSDLVQLVKKTSPTVVSIITAQLASSGFTQQVAEGAGTGIIISSDGYILTNRHVVSGAQSVTIVTSIGDRYENVRVVGSDPLNDIAFLKINGVKDLPVASLGDSGATQVGQGVIAIGNSLGQYDNTVTRGIISGLGRPVTAASNELGTRVESLTDLLQTDAAINPGNSGGPLINMVGQVIGINTAIVSDAQSVGFAIPINATKGLIRGLLKDGTIQKAYVGVRYVAITPDIRAQRNLSVRNGALVESGNSTEAVASGSPAEKAGIRAGDIITKVDDKVVGEQGGFGSLVAEFLPGEKVTLTIVRDNKTMEIPLTLGSFPAQN